MAESLLAKLFGLEGRVAVVTGGTGVLGGAMAHGLAGAGAKVGVLGRRRERAEEVVAAIAAGGGEGLALTADVLDREQVAGALAATLDHWGRVDILVNAAGGNVPAATLTGDKSVFDLPQEAFSQVFDLNLLGTVVPTLVFGAAMARPQDGEVSGCIVNISSMAAQRTLTRVIGYSAAKAAVDNFTRWMATDLARRHGDGLRVNAIAPGFFVTEQNRAMLVGPGGDPTERGQTIIDHTPAGRLGEPDELVSTLLWLCGPGAAFVNGVVVPVDGGFNAFSGV